MEPGFILRVLLTGWVQSVGEPIWGPDRKLSDTRACLEQTTGFQRLVIAMAWPSMSIPNSVFVLHRGSGARCDRCLHSVRSHQRVAA
jgi:hypothetical protein